LNIENYQLQISNTEPSKRIRVHFSIDNFQCSFFNVLIFALIALCSGCIGKLPGKPDPGDVPVPAERVLKFDTVFGRNCAGCHGVDGTLGPAPPLNESLFRALVTESELEKVLLQGRKGTQMAPFAHSNGGPLSAAQVSVLVYEIKGVPYRIVTNEKSQSVQPLKPGEKGITPKWGTSPAALRSVPALELPEKPGDAASGARVFIRACAVCHGENGMGVEANGKVRNRINERAFLALMSDQAIRRIIITGRNDLQMPDYASTLGRGDDFKPLTSEEINDLGALLSAWRQGKSK